MHYSHWTPLISATSATTLTRQGHVLPLHYGWYLPFWTFDVLSSLLLKYCSYPGSAKSCPSPCFLFSALILQPKFRLPVPFALPILWFPNCPLFFPLLTPIPFLCSYQINLKIQLWSGSQPISDSALPNEKILHSFGSYSRLTYLFPTTFLSFTNPVPLMLLPTCVTTLFCIFSRAPLASSTCFSLGSNDVSHLYSHPSFKAKLKLHNICSTQVWRINHVLFVVPYFYCYLSMNFKDLWV